MRLVQTNNQVADFHASPESVALLFVLLDACPLGKIFPGELSVAFLDDATICHLHETFLDDPSPTDVITFPGEDEDDGTGERFAGEICVCVAQARREAARHGNTLAEEVLLYLVHGWLHLAGFDDIEDDARRAMRDAEQAALAYLREAGFVLRVE
ncbi:MAG: rRNA maturation RNase YbeY [Puniceicoccales bacterium]|jgi:probable rRNA maturation factor|nr:rRNA maturation RNase YbeY [Puniceicoccales bacterium]